MATATPNYTSDQTITITIASLANGSTNTSNAIDNGTNKFIEAIVQVKVRSNSAGTSSTGYVNVWFIRTADNGTTYDDNNKQLLFSFPVTANSTTYIASGSTLPLGTLPKQWKIAIENRSGAALDSTAGNHEAQFEGIKLDIA